jgi:NAD dependent epimerase/dehydratase
MSFDWQDKQILITGAGGFIGSHLVEQLVAEGARVRAFVRYNSRQDSGLLALLPKPQLDTVEIVAGDLRDANAILQAARGCDTIFHLGALIAIPYSYLHPREVVETNILGTFNVLMAGRDLGTRRIVHTSTSEVYGTALYTPIDEAHPLQGQSPYSASKIGADKIVESFWRSYELPVVTVRPFNTYGPRQSTRAVIPTIITQALARDVIRLGDLGTRRDFTYVADTVDGFVRAATAPDVAGKEINLGNDEDITIGALAELILRLLGKEARVEIDPSRMRPAASEVRQLHASAERAGRLLGWHATVDLEEGLRRTIDWFRGHLDRYRIGEYTV